MNVSMEFLRTICKLGQREKCCRYLGAGSKGWECLKTTHLKEIIDKQVVEMGAKGDNCEGKEN